MLPPGHEAFGALHQIKAQNLEKRGEHTAALREAALALGIFSAHPGLMYRAAVIHERMAGILLAMGNLPQALAEVQQARKIFEAAFGPGASLPPGPDLAHRGENRQIQGGVAERSPAAETAYRHFSVSVGETHPLTVEAKALR